MNIRVSWTIVLLLMFCVTSSGSGSDPPGTVAKEKNSIQSLFDGIPVELRSKIQNNAVRRDRVNDWLTENVNGKGKTIEVRLPVRVLAERSKDGTYNIGLEVSLLPRVNVLGDGWFTELRDRGSLKEAGSPSFGFVGVSSGDAEKLADLKEVTITGKVEEAKVGSRPFRPLDINAILLILQDVQLDGKTLTPGDPGKGEQKKKGIVFKRPQ